MDFKAEAATWLVSNNLDSLAELLKRAYAAGYRDGEWDTLHSSTY
jgi:hypothetical protein